MGTSKFKLEELIDTTLFQDLQEKLNNVYSFPSAIIDNEGKILTAVAWQDICTKFHRKHPECEKECIKSDQYIYNHLHEANPAVSYKCPHGLVDNATPIVIEGKHLGNFFTGQFFLEKPDLDFFRKQAKKYGFDEKEYLEAVTKVPIWTEEKVAIYLEFIKGFIQIIASIALKNLKEKEINEDLLNSEERFRMVIENSANMVTLHDSEGKYLYYTGPKKYGIKPSDVIGKTPHDFFENNIANQITEQIKTTFQTGEEKKMEIYINWQGKMTWFEENIYPIKKDNKIISVVKICTDITDRKFKEMELLHAKEFAENNEKKLKLFFDTLTEGVALNEIIYNEHREMVDYRILEVNNAFYKIVDYSSVDVIGNLASKVYRMSPETIKAFWENHKNKSEITFTEFQSPISKRWFYISTSPFINDKFVTSFINITHIKETENDLIKAKEKAEESEQKYRTIFEGAPIGIFRSTKEGRFIEINHSLAIMLGYSSPQEVLDSITDISEQIYVDSQKRDAIISDITKSEIHKYENIYKRKNGEHFLANLFVKEVIDEKGNIILEGLVEETTAIKNKEAELIAAKEKAEELQERFDYATSIGKVGTWDWNLVTDDLIWSTETYRILGYEPFSVKPSYELFLNIVHPDDREYLDSNVKAAWNEKKPYCVDCHIILSNNEVRICNATGKVEYDNANKPVRMIGTFQDITERKNIEKSLLLRESYLRAMIENQPGLVWIKDSEGRFLSANSAFNQACGEEKLFGKTDLDIWPEEMAHKYQDDDKEVIRSKESKIVEELIYEKKKVKWFETFKAPIFDDEGNVIGTTGYSRDITDRKKKEEELIKAKEKAEESDRLKTAFLQNVSHEIRTPMNAIMGFSELLMLNYGDKSKLEHFTNIINQRCSDLLLIIDDILDISKIESGQLKVSIEPCNLKSLFAEIQLFFNEHQIKIGKQHINFTFQPQCDASRLVITTDKVKLKQIFINLIGNAFKFTDKGQIEGGCRFDNSDTITFYVSDTGIGIPIEKQEKIFERFVQLEPAPNRFFGGTGLGLSIVKGLVNLLGGKLWLESEPGVGSTFYFSLPYNPQQTITNEQKIDDSNNNVTNYQHKTILIVEDDKFNAAYINEVLTGIKVKTILVQYGKEAVDKAILQPIDLVLMDIGLPDITGYEAIQQILQHKPDLKIIAQTAYATEEDKEKALSAGCVDYISKPLKSKLLLSLVNRHLL